MTQSLTSVDILVEVTLKKLLESQTQLDPNLIDTVKQNLQAIKNVCRDLSLG